jgi:hypothetical protein
MWSPRRSRILVSYPHGCIRSLPNVWYFVFRKTRIPRENTLLLPNVGEWHAAGTYRGIPERISYRYRYLTTSSVSFYGTKTSHTSLDSHTRCIVVASVQFLASVFAALLVSCRWL